MGNIVFPSSNDIPRWIGMDWLSHKMTEQKAYDPQHILHLVCARLEELGAPCST